MPKIQQAGSIAEASAAAGTWGIGVGGEARVEEEWGMRAQTLDRAFIPQTMDYLHIISY